MDISFVTTLYMSAPHLREFYSRLYASALAISDDYEIILVNDGSPDDSLGVALDLFSHDPKVKIIDLSRNFGHHKAMMTGLSYARGDLIFLIDCDLEEEPELLNVFYAKMRETGADVIYGVQQERKGGFFERVSGYLFFRLFNLLSSYPIPENLIHARLMSKRYVTSLLEHQEREVYVPGLMVITGYDQVPVLVNKHHRGKSTYSLKRKVDLMVNAITSFSIRPLIYIFFLGCLILIFSGLSGLYLIIRRMFFGMYLEGWPILILSIWLLGGLTISCIGIVGIYISKIFMETKPRPYTVIRQVYEYKNNPQETKSE